METVSASHYRVFSVDPPHLPSPACAGKKVPSGVLTDTLRRNGLAYGRMLHTLREHALYDLAKLEEEFAEYLVAPPERRVAEMADIATAIAMARKRLQGIVTLLPRQPYSMRAMAHMWRVLQKEADGMETDLLQKRMFHLLACSHRSVLAEQTLQGLAPSAVRKAQRLKQARLGDFEGWVVTHLALPHHEEDLCRKLLASGWYENAPDADNRFGHLRIDRSLNLDHFQTVTSG